MSHMPMITGWRFARTDDPPEPHRGCSLSRTREVGHPWVMISVTGSLLDTCWLVGSQSEARTSTRAGVDADSD